LTKNYIFFFHLDSTNISSNEIIPFDVRLCLVDRSFSDKSSDSSIRNKSIDIQHYRNKFSISIDEYTSSIIIDYLLNGNKQLIEQTYEFILKYIEKSPEHALIFYSTYVKCLLSTNSIVFQMAIEHFSHFIIYFQSKSNELFSLLLKQGLINKIDVTSSITQAIRLLNLHRYDPITYTNSASTSTSTMTTTATND
jgi:hypothetical protein